MNLLESIESAKRANAENLISSPWLFPAYQTWQQAKHRVAEAKAAETAAAAVWLASLHHVLEDPVLRRKAEKAGLVPK